MVVRLRALFIIGGQDGRDLLLARRFPTVERRTRFINLANTSSSSSSTTASSPSNNVNNSNNNNSSSSTWGGGIEPIPSNEDFLRLYRQKLLSVVDLYDESLMTFSLMEGRLWPIVRIYKRGISYLAIPLVENAMELTFNPELQVFSREEEYPFIDMPCITGAITVLEDLYEYCSAFESQAELIARMSVVQAYISQALPFGSPVDTNPNNVRSIMRIPFPTKDLALNNQKRPAWKIHTIKGKHKLTLIIRETILAIQYDKPNVPDYSTTSGEILCNAELEGYKDVSVQLSCPSSGEGAGGSSISQLTFHPCVQSPGTSATTNNSTGFSSSSSSSSTLVFSPPTDMFTLCKYSVTNNTNVRRFPIRGFYQMKEISENSVRMLLQLKLMEESIRNDFEYCDVIIPFFNRRGRISHMELSPTAGQVSVGSDGSSIIWRLGTKFTSARNLEIAMPGTVFFDNTLHEAHMQYKDDPFLVGPNSFVVVSFKVTNFCLSGLHVDPRGVVTSPSTPSKLQVVVRRELVSKNYRIWNSLGDVAYVHQPKPQQGRQQQQQQQQQQGAAK